VDRTGHDLTMKYGYARVSTDGQSIAAQVAALRKLGAGKVYREVASGAKTDRTQLRRVLDQLAAGDVLMVTRLDRLARSTRDLLNTLAAITDKKAGFRALGDAWADTTTSHGRLMLTVLAGLAEFERDQSAAGRAASVAGHRGGVRPPLQPRCRGYRDHQRLSDSGDTACLRAPALCAPLSRSRSAARRDHADALSRERRRFPVCRRYRRSLEASVKQLSLRLFAAIDCLIDPRDQLRRQRASGGGGCAFRKFRTVLHTEHECVDVERQRVPMRQHGRKDADLVG
jgi:Resolvase, N terminal domain